MSSAQQQLWNEEHREPAILLPMEYLDPSSGIVRFAHYLEEQSIDMRGLRGIEMGCGKGRNSIWLAKQGMHMTGFDFSDVAIDIAQKRAEEAGVSDHAAFLVADATQSWPFEDATFDIGIDCFASSDIDTLQGRVFARDEFQRVLKPNALLFVFAISTGSPFHARMLKESPADEPHSFKHPGGKFEKVFDEEELRSFYADWEIVELDLMRKEKHVQFYGEEFDSENFWMVLRRGA